MHDEEAHFRDSTPYSTNDIKSRYIIYILYTCRLTYILYIGIFSESSRAGGITMPTSSSGGGNVPAGMIAL